MTTFLVELCAPVLDICLENSYSPSHKLILHFVRSPELILYYGLVLLCIKRDS